MGSNSDCTATDSVMNEHDIFFWLFKAIELKLRGHRPMINTQSHKILHLWYLLCGAYCDQRTPSTGKQWRRPRRRVGGGDAREASEKRHGRCNETTKGSITRKRCRDTQSHTQSTDFPSPNLESNPISKIVKSEWNHTDSWDDSKTKIWMNLGSTSGVQTNL